MAKHNSQSLYENQDIPTFTLQKNYKLDAEPLIDSEWY